MPLFAKWDDGVRRTTKTLDLDIDHDLVRWAAEKLDCRQDQALDRIIDHVVEQIEARLVETVPVVVASTTGRYVASLPGSPNPDLDAEGFESMDRDLWSDHVFVRRATKRRT